MRKSIFSELFNSNIPKFTRTVAIAIFSQVVAFNAAAQLPELAGPTSLTGYTSARFFAGATIDDGATFVSSVAAHQPVSVHLEIQIEPDHIDSGGNIYVVAELDGSLFMLDESGSYHYWDRNLSTLLPAISGKTLQAVEHFTMFENIALGPQGADGKTIEIYVAYDTYAEAGQLFHNSSPFCLSVVHTDVAFNGWSTMNNTLEDQNTSGSFNPHSFDDPSLYAMVGEMYRANGIAGYSYDFAFLPQGSDFIDGPTALENINSTTSSVAVISAYGGRSGITENPATADDWIDKMINVAQVARNRNITPIMFQAWGEANLAADFGNAKTNTDALQSRYDILVVRSAEIVEALGQLNPEYIANTMSPNGKYSAPVIHLFSGGYQDEFHGSYAMAYANALATFKVLTGISAHDNKFVIPSGGLVGTQYGMSDTFIYDIIATVDSIQQETLASH